MQHCANIPGRGYDFGADERWAAYLKNIEIPTGDQASVRLRLQAKWYKKNVESDFDPEWISAPTPAPTSTFMDRGASANPPPSATPPPQQQQQQRATPAPPRAPAPAYPQSFTSRTSLLVFLLHLFLVLAGLLHLVPFVPFSNTAYVYFMRAAVACQLLKTYTAHGKPHFPPWSNIMVYLQRIVPTSDFFHLLVTAAFMPHRPISLAILPLMVVSLYHAANYAAANSGRSPTFQRVFAPVHRMLLSRQREAFHCSAYAEIALGFLLIFQLVTPMRNLTLIFFYWNLLKMRYQAPDSSASHRQVWQGIDAKTASMRRRFPIVEQGLGYVQAWFLKVQ
ncbi:MAG: hypothetical protein WDW38_002688 [Sanguina aurantia]